MMPPGSVSPPGNGWAGNTFTEVNVNQKEHGRSSFQSKKWENWNSNCLQCFNPFAFHFWDNRPHIYGCVLFCWVWRQNYNEAPTDLNRNWEETSGYKVYLITRGLQVASALHQKQMGFVSNGPMTSNVFFTRKKIKNKPTLLMTNSLFVYLVCLF